MVKASRIAKKHGSKSILIENKMHKYSLVQFIYVQKNILLVKLYGELNRQ